MKAKFLPIFASAMMMLAGFTSCKDEIAYDYTEPDTQEVTPTETTDYTVIVWSEGGNQDQCLTSELASIILDREKGELKDNVNLVGCLQTSERFADDLASRNIHGSITFDLGKKRNLSNESIKSLEKYAGPENMDKCNTPNELARYMDVTMHCMTRFNDDTKLDVTSPTDLAAFIKKAAKEHPARNYVLVLYGHGNGYDPSIKTEALAGKKVMYDSAFLAEGVANAIRTSGVKIQTAFFQCCHMASLENIAEMSSCVDYMIASSEVTTSGYFPAFVKYIASAGDNIEALKEASRHTVDTYVENDKDLPYVTSHGFYDLQYTDKLLSEVKNAANWFAAANVSNPDFMKTVARSTTWYLNDYINPGNFREYKEMDETLSKARTNARKLLDADASMTDDEFKNILTNILTYCAYSITANTEYSFCDMMNAALSNENSKAAAGLDFTTLRTIYDNYMSTLKTMAYIKATGASDAEVAYKLCSPTVNLFAMNERGYKSSLHKEFYKDMGVDHIVKQDKVQEIVNEYNTLKAKGNENAAQELFEKTFGGCSAAQSQPDLKVMTSTYTATRFDRQTSWSRVLTTLPYNPICLLNPQRLYK